MGTGLRAWREHLALWRDGQGRAACARGTLGRHARTAPLRPRKPLAPGAASALCGGLYYRALSTTADWARARARGDPGVATGRARGPPPEAGGPPVRVQRARRRSEEKDKLVTAPATSRRLTTTPCRARFALPVACLPLRRLPPLSLSLSMPRAFCRRKLRELQRLIGFAPRGAKLAYPKEAFLFCAAFLARSGSPRSHRPSPPINQPSHPHMPPLHYWPAMSDSIVVLFERNKTEQQHNIHSPALVRPPPTKNSTAASPAPRTPAPRALWAPG